MKKANTIDGLMPPPWLMFPHIRKFSIGWRMGYGESYKDEFNSWFTALPNDEKSHYQAMFPSPKTWAGYFDGEDSLDQFDNFMHGIDLWRRNGEPLYTKDWLIARQNSGEKLEFMYFWKPGKAPHDCFGQWQPSEFREEILSYTCAEQYMMAKKARIFEDEETEKRIIETSDPKLMKSLGRKVKNFDEKTWDELRHSVVLNGNYQKFAQNKEMRETLLGTGDKILVEASPLDVIWGIGYAENNPNAGNPLYWRGLNLLGFALMEVRDEIKSVYQSYDKIDWRQFEDYT
jgi:ribA/ribD-fused uncharacterized protein